MIALEYDALKAAVSNVRLPSIERASVASPVLLKLTDAGLGVASDNRDALARCVVPTMAPPDGDLDLMVPHKALDDALGSVAAAFKPEVVRLGVDEKGWLAVDIGKGKAALAPLHRDTFPRRTPLGADTTTLDFGEGGWRALERVGKSLGGNDMDDLHWALDLLLMGDYAYATDLYSVARWKLPERQEELLRLPGRILAAVWRTKEPISTLVHDGTMFALSSAGCSWTARLGARAKEVPAPAGIDGMFSMYRNEEPVDVTFNRAEAIAWVADLMRMEASNVNVVMRFGDGQLQMRRTDSSGQHIQRDMPATHPEDPHIVAFQGARILTALKALEGETVTMRGVPGRTLARSITDGTIDMAVMPVEL